MKNFKMRDFKWIYPVLGAWMLAVSLVALPATGFATLNPVDIWSGNVGLSIDAVGSNNTPVGDIQAEIPVGSTILAAYLYSVGTPYPWYANSPQTTADYNGAGIMLEGNSITNFDTLVGAISTPRPDIGQWFTGRADVTSLVQSLATGGPAYSWEVAEGSALNNRIDGEVLVIVYENALLPESSVVLLDGGQDTGGESTVVNFGTPLGDVTDPGFFADMSMAISFSTGFSQSSQVDINGTRLTSAAGGFDDGAAVDGGLITAGGVGDSNSNPLDPTSSSAADDELYNLIPFLSQGDTGFTIFTNNPSADDNIFMMGLHITADVSSVNPVPEPATMLLLGAGLLGLAGLRNRMKE
jgi:hypothetical protein